MIQKTTAVFENGHLTLTKPLHGIPEHSVVQVTVEQQNETTREARLAMLRRVPVCEGLADAIEEGRKRPWQVEEF